MANAEVLQEGTLHCFPTGLRDENGEVVNVEVSAVVYDGQRLILASDKSIPGETRSAVFSVPMTDAGPDDSELDYLTADAIKRAVKYEDFALTADGGYVLATTGFDRIDMESHALNAYNHLLIWPLGEPERVQVVDPDPRDGVEGSLELRNKLDGAIGEPYYKIEGLAAVPGERGDGLLLFGVREQGRSHEDFEYVCRVVGAHYTVNEHGNLVLIDELREFYRFSPRQHPEVRFDCGLSSLEYDPHHGRLFLMTSFEVEEAGESRIGGYLWVVSLAGFSEGQAPELVRTVKDDVLEFEHKAEGLAVLDSERLFVAYDNDRDMSLGSIDERDERHACEAPYTILRLT
ncbi:hypothetical protein C8E00_10747 [Chromohalobacter marismortui]|uniref:Phytase-like protein with esterase activity n=1 Tax=Chromohalobacter marismortui TaxID=42055 RepID=A0A4R7NIC5_9GAMM|nr:MULTISPECIES: hypothetical protein [Chromohalobacter]MCI0510918.1 hypothetical protein [Chromohalobacter sp.]MCI0592946.1 hypothetical protein [Chromohalobacter sp.]TDU20148.1 hypothetical protein C8E00_10747 [Chromohalobacter marismortui]